MTDEIIRVDGSRAPYSPVGAHYTLEELRKAIGGGYIQIVHTKDGRLIVMDEEGKLKGLPINAAATALYPYGEHDPVVGDVLVVNSSRIKTA